jgi:hypothetical protein
MMREEEPDVPHATAVTVRRFRSVPPSSTILVAQGQAVVPNTPIAKTEALPGKLWRVDIGDTLKVDRSRVPNRLVLRAGERVTQGGIVAVGGSFFYRRAARSPVKGVLSLVSKTRGAAYVREDVEVGAHEEPVEVPVAKMLGVPTLAIMMCKTADANMGTVMVKGQVLARFGKATATSPLYGRITGISPVKGTITIAPLFKSHAISAYLMGSVERVVPGDGVEVIGRAVVINGAWGLGGESSGHLHVIDGDLTEEAALTEGSVVAARGTASYEGLLHAAQSGVNGVVVGWMSSKTAIGFAGGIRNMGITGDETAPFPLILIQGFLREAMRQDLLEFLADFEGALCSLTGATHIRAGVVRPEVLIFPDQPGG